MTPRLIFYGMRGGYLTQGSLPLYVITPSLKS